MKKILLLICIVTLSILTLIGCSARSDGDNTSQDTEAKSSANEVKEEKKVSDDWPKKTIELVVPFGAGGDTDFNARAYAKYLEDELGVSVIVVNIEGAGGSIASTKVKGAKPDGYTVLFFDTALQLNEASGVSDFGYDAFEVSGIVAKSAGEFVTVRKGMPVDTVADLIELTKQEPNKYKLAANTGATTHYASAVLKDEGAKFNVVNSGSSAERVAALKGKHIDVMVNTMGTIKSYVEAGEFKILGNTASKRSEVYPDYPTCLEQGINLSYDVCYNMLLPKGTDPQIAEKLNAAAQKVAEKPEYAEDIKKAFGQTPFVLNVEDSKEFLRDEHEKFMKYKDVFRTGK